MKISFTRKMPLGTFIYFPTMYYDNINDMSRKVLDISKLSASRGRTNDFEKNLGLSS